MPIDQQKVRSWVQIFLKHVSEVGERYHVEEEEGYKFEAVEHFQKHFDLGASDIVNMLDVSIPNNNLVIASMYFPKKMLLIFASLYPQRVREILGNLFDESLPVDARLTTAESAFEALMQERNRAENRQDNSYISLRFLSLLLGLRYPDKYNPLKPSEWRVFAKYIDEDFRMPKRLSAGEQYELYTPFIEALREHVKVNEAVQSLKHKLTESNTFKDTESRWMTQNIIYVGARAYASQMAVSPDNLRRIEETLVTEDEITEKEFNTGFFAYENHLEEYIIKNWNNINFGEELKIYIDEGGSDGQQYTTDVGIIDVLATDKNGDFVVIELKRAESGYKVVGQVLNYIGWVQEKIADDEGKNVRGIIVVGKADKTLRSALKPVAGKILLKEYRTHLELRDPD